MNSVNSHLAPLFQYTNVNFQLVGAIFKNDLDLFLLSRIMSSKSVFGSCLHNWAWLELNGIQVTD